MPHEENVLFLHEAIAIVLLTKFTRNATTEEIADEINKRKLYKRKDNLSLPAYQVMQRTKLCKGQYKHLFQFISPNTVKLK